MQNACNSRIKKNQTEQIYRYFSPAGEPAAIQPRSPAPQHLPCLRLSLQPVHPLTFHSIGKSHVYDPCHPLWNSLPSAPRGNILLLNTLPVCIQCRLQTTPSFCQPRSSRRASLSSQQLRSRAFSVAGPAIWNWLPDSMRDPAISRDSFRRSLKTFLFSAYLCT